MITKLSLLLPELTTAQLNDVDEWLTTKTEPTLSERIQAYLENNDGTTLKLLGNRLRLPPEEIIGSLNKLIDHGIIERYSAGEFKIKYRMKR